MPHESAQFNAIVALTQRELIRFLRQRTRVVGAVGQPIIYWILFGAGLRSSFTAPSWAASLPHTVSYQEYFLPGIAALIVLSLLSFLRSQLSKTAGKDFCRVS